MTETTNHPETGLKALATELQELKETINDPEKGLEALNRRFDIYDVRNSNRSSIRTTGDAIHKLPNRDGDIPREGLWFPTTTLEIASSTHDDLNGLLAFYDLEKTGLVEEKRNRLKSDLGITI